MSALCTDVQTLLNAAKIVRPEKEIEHAIDGAVASYQDETGHALSDPDLLPAVSPDVWHDIVHARFGVLDLLEIDSEDALYDRLAA